MRERPILCSDSVALNIRASRQTQHRAPMKPQPFHLPGGWYWHRRTPGGKDRTKFNIHECHWRERPHEWAPWQPGDVLYVRECWARLPTAWADWPIVYRADYIKGNGRDWWHESRLFDGRWRPNIHMPKWAARTWTQPLGRVWAEESQDWSENVARAAGFESLATFTEFMRTAYGSILPRWWWACSWPGVDLERSGVTS